MAKDLERAGLAIRRNQSFKRNGIAFQRIGSSGI